MYLRFAVQDMQQLAQLGQVQSVRLMAGSCNCLLPACYKTHDRLIAQARSLCLNVCMELLPVYSVQGICVCSGVSSMRDSRVSLTHKTRS